MQDLNHMHVLISAVLAKPPTTVDAMDSWLLDAVKAVDMKVLMGPFSTRCDAEGNEGVTGIVVIETSHLSAHCWDTAPVPFIKVDLYSCKRFDPQAIRNLLMRFDPYWIDMMVVDRNEEHTKVIRKDYEQVINVFDLMPEDMQNACLSGQAITPKQRSAVQIEAIKTFKDLTQKFTVKMRNRSYKAEHFFAINYIKTRASEKGLAFELTVEWYEDAVRKARVKWPKLTVHGRGLSFWTACIDRINPTRGYTQENCRVIPHALDVAKQEWSSDEFSELVTLINQEAI